jgi:phage-related protein
MTAGDKPLAWLGGEVKSPPFSPSARLEAGFLLRQLQRGLPLTMPQSRPMPSIGPRVHELRVIDGGVSWRVIYRVDADAIVIAHVFAKKSRTTPASMIDLARKRLKRYDDAD